MFAINYLWFSDCLRSIINTRSIWTIYPSSLTQKAVGDRSAEKIHVSEECKSNKRVLLFTLSLGPFSEKNKIKQAYGPNWVPVLSSIRFVPRDRFCLCLFSSEELCIRKREQMNCANIDISVSCKTVQTRFSKLQNLSIIS